MRLQSGIGLWGAYIRNRYMKKDLHAKDYRLVIFEDLNDGSRILTRSTVRTEETTKWEDGKDYPLFKVHISSSSHPFYTGNEKLLDMEGRVDRFKARQDAAAKAKADKLAKVQKQSKAKKAPAKKPSTEETKDK